MSRSKITQDDEDLDIFCQLEEALREEEKTEEEKNGKQNNAGLEFPDSLINADGKIVDEEVLLSRNDKNDFHETYVELQQHLTEVKRREADIVRDENWIKAEKKEIEKEKKKIATDKMIVKEKLASAEIADLREKYEKLQMEFDEAKKQWEAERAQMKSKITQLERKNRPKVTFITPDLNKIQENPDKPIYNGPNLQQENEKEEEKQANKMQEQQPDAENVQDENRPAVEMHDEPVKIGMRPTRQAPDSPKGGRRRKPKVYRINVHDNYPLDFDYNPGSVYKEEHKRDGRRIVRYKDGSLGTVFRNGTKKIKKSGTIYIFYSNGDVCIEYQDGAVGYRYKETQAIELALPDKSMIYIFKNGQKEKHYTTGDKVIQFPNGVYKIIHANGDTETHHPDGKTETNINGQLTVSYDFQD